jgi:uncharacterized protein
MGKAVLFIHSAGPQGPGEDSSGLAAYLKDSLKGFEVRNPSMPTPENPQYEEWKAVLKEELSRMPEDAVLIGHSIGGSALLKYFLEEEVESRYKKLITIGSPFWGIDNEWIKADFTLTKDRAAWNTALPPIILVHSIGDKVVPHFHMERYKEVLPEAHIREIAGEDHLFQEGFKELREMLLEN